MGNAKLASTLERTLCQKLGLRAAIRGATRAGEYPKPDRRMPQRSAAATRYDSQPQPRILRQIPISRRNYQKWDRIRDGKQKFSRILNARIYRINFAR
jgi:hypothetical protein